MSSLVCPRLNIGTLCCRGCNEKQVSTSCCFVGFRECKEVVTCSTCTPSICGAYEVTLFHQRSGTVRQAYNRYGCCLPLWPSGSNHPVLKVIDRPTWTPGTNAWRFTILKGLTYSVTWCNCRLTHLKVTKQTTPNELLRHRHVSSPLPQLCLMCVRSAPALVESHDHYHHPHHLPGTWRTHLLFSEHDVKRQGLFRLAYTLSKAFV